MVKPQFELGRERVGRGVVRDAADRREAILAVAEAARETRAADPRLRLLRAAGAEGEPRDLRLVRRRRPRDRRPGGGDRRRRGGRVKTAALITHSHPPSATEAVAIAAEVAHEAGWRLVATEDELRKHGAAGEGIDVTAEHTVPDICLVLGGDGSILHALRRFAHTEVPVFGVNFGTVGFLAAVERDDAAAGDPPRARRGDRDGRAARPRGRRVDGEAGHRPQRHHPRPPPARPRRRAQLPDRRRGGRPRPLRRPRRRHPGRLDRLQPRQPGTDPRLGREGIRGQLHLAALADRAGAGRRPRRRPPRRQRTRARAGRSRGRRRQGRRPRRGRGAGGPLRRRRSAASPSCREPASTSASARSSATWLSRGDRHKPNYAVL